MAHVAGVLVVELSLELPARDLHLRGVDHDDVVAGIHVRGERRLVLAADDARDLGRQASEHHAFGIDDEPAVLDVAGFRAVRFHETSLNKDSNASPVRNATRVSAANGRFKTESQDRQRVNRGQRAVLAVRWLATDILLELAPQLSIGTSFIFRFWMKNSIMRCAFTPECPWSGPIWSSKCFPRRLERRGSSASSCSGGRCCRRCRSRAAARP